jgi:UDP-glucose 4-epimerase
VSFNAALAETFCEVTDNPDKAQRLCGSLQVDISKTRKLLGWTPLISLDERLKRAAGGYEFEVSI